MLNSTKGQAQRLQREWPWSCFQVRLLGHVQLTLRGLAQLGSPTKVRFK